MSSYDSQADRGMPDDPARSPREVRSEHNDLQGGLDGLAAMVSGTFTLSELLREVAGFAASAVPGADEAGVIVLRERARPDGAGGDRDASTADTAAHVQAWGSTAAVVEEIDRIQYERTQEGPCLTCMRSGRPAVSGSLGSDGRWPRFGGRVARLRVHSALSLPLVSQGRVIGAINSYAWERDVFTENAVRLGEQFAGPAAVAVHNARVLAGVSARAEQLQAALRSRAVIDQAIGILRSRSGGSAEEAFERLTRLSQHRNERLALVADDLVDEAVRRAHVRRPQE